jgi:hypothetical protein
VDSRLLRSSCVTASWDDRRRATRVVDLGQVALSTRAGSACWSRVWRLREAGGDLELVVPEGPTTKLRDHGPAGARVRSSVDAAVGSHRGRVRSSSSAPWPSTGHGAAFIGDRSSCGRRLMSSSRPAAGRPEACTDAGGGRAAPVWRSTRPRRSRSRWAPPATGERGRPRGLQRIELFALLPNASVARAGSARRSASPP